MIKAWKPVVLLALVTAAAARSAAAQDGELIGDRPDFTESPNVVRRWQIEAGYTVTRLPGGARAHEVGEALLRAPLGARLEGRIGVGSFLTSDVAGSPSGYGGSSLGVKWAIASARGGLPDLGLIVGTVLPTGDAEVGGDEWVPEARLAAAWEGLVSASANVGLARPEAAGDRFTQFLASLALGVSLAERVAAFGETYVVLASESPGDDEVVLDGGVTWLLTPDLQVDARAGVSLEFSGDSPIFFGVGLVARL